MDFSDQINLTYNNFTYIDHTTDPTSLPDKWLFEGRYMKSQTGGILYWQIGFDLNTYKLISLHGYYITSGGHYGKLQVSEVDVEENLSGRDTQEQALLEARKKLLDKIRDGYLTANE